MSKNVISNRTRANWLIDVAVFISAIVASVSGIYFLFLPSGGYRGGRNPWYGITILFDRHTWEDLHTWGGVAMIAAVAIHLVIHWKWVVSMAGRIARELSGQGARLSAYGHFNVALDALVGLSFLVTAVSGVYFMFAPAGSHGARATTGWLFANTTWDLIHTWAGVVMIIAAVVHLAIHWRWVVNVTKKVLASLWTRSQTGELSLAH